MPHSIDKSVQLPTGEDHHFSELDHKNMRKAQEKKAQAQAQRRYADSSNYETDSMSEEESEKL